MTIFGLLRGIVQLDSDAVLPELLAVVDEIYGFLDGYVQFMNGSTLILIWALFLTLIFFHVHIYLYFIYSTLREVGRDDRNNNVRLFDEFAFISCYIVMFAIVFKSIEFFIFSSIWSFITSACCYLYELSKLT